MDASEFVESVEEEARTELDRLGSEKVLVALTGANLDADAVLGAAAASERAARETFESWAADESDESAREAFSAAAEREADHRERVAAELGDGADATTELDPMHDHLRGLEGTVERVAAGLVGRALVADRTLLQVVNFFVNEADEHRAELFRGLREETADARDAGVDLLADLCAGEEDWERAREAAVATVRVAYDAYAETVEGMGLDPKPLC